jgi:hypothetical protein
MNSDVDNISESYIMAVEGLEEITWRGYKCVKLEKSNELVLLVPINQTSVFW